MKPEQPIEIDGNTPIEITLIANQWAHILSALDEMPYKIARPISDKINSEILKIASPEPELEEDEDEKEKEDEIQV